MAACDVTSCSFWLLCDEEVNDNGVCGLAFTLEKNSCVTFLDLSRNHVTDVSVAVMLKVAF